MIGIEFQAYPDGTFGVEYNIYDRQKEIIESGDDRMDSFAEALDCLLTTLKEHADTTIEINSETVEDEAQRSVLGNIAELHYARWDSLRQSIMA